MAILRCPSAATPPGAAKLTAGGIASRVALYDSGGIIETNQVRYKKNPSRDIALDGFQQF